jgi:hypothetical protein
MARSDKILNTFQRISNDDNKIKLINVYKGIPISYPAKEIKVDSNRVHVTTDPYQVVGLYRERETYIQSNEFPFNFTVKCCSS